MHILLMFHTGMLWQLHVQSTAFSDNPIMETVDWQVSARLRNVGVVVSAGMLPLLRIKMNAAFLVAVDLSNEIQFRLLTKNASTGAVYTNFDDSYVLCQRVVEDPCSCLMSHHGNG